jgi:DinB superfamily
MSIEWNGQLVDQLDWHWQHHARPRLDNLTDDEYLWEPVGGCWSVRNRAAVPTGITHGAGEYVLEYAWPEPSPPPVTTIAWRMAHIIVGVLGQRNAAHFDGPPTDYDTHVYATTAAEALRQLDEAYAVWTKGVRGLGEQGLARPCGPAEGPYAEFPLAALILHINRETIHHAAEIALLRDLYRNQG